MSAGDSRPRWERLVGTLDAAGVDAKLTERSYAEVVRGRVEHGVSRSIYLSHPAGGLVVIRDRQWSRNGDVWLGWAVSREDAEGIVVRDYPLTKKRAEVRDYVAQALDLEEVTS